MRNSPGSALLLGLSTMRRPMALGSGARGLARWACDLASDPR